MKVFKFGGASVKDAASVKNVADILKQFPDEKIAVVISAMGKTTNALEKVVHAYYHQTDELENLLLVVRKFHADILNQLGFSESDKIFHEIDNSFTEMEWVFEEKPHRPYSFIYDQIVSHGELMSTKIVAAYLKKENMKSIYLDVRDVLQSDNTWREGKINWPITEQLSASTFEKLFAQNDIVITQGFIACTSENYTTTLGREGSDYTAAILSYCLNAESMTVWKDVPGVLSADPKFYSEAVKLNQISYHDAIELTYYGATVIHPKTIKPLENKHIPLHVRSFMSSKEKGTEIGNFKETKPLVPSFIFKSNQILISISAKDFSFIAEENLSIIFGIFAKHNVKVNLMLNSAISFSVCMDNDVHRIPPMIEELQSHYKVLYNDGLRLVTVRHYYPSTIDFLSKGKTILVEQRSRHTAQLVMKEEN